MSDEFTDMVTLLYASIPLKNYLGDSKRRGSQKAV